jgi:lactoylglutathione lyase
MSDASKAAPDLEANVFEVIPFHGVTNMQESLKFYVDGLGFTMANSWKPEGTVRWCMLKLDGVRIMLQEYYPKSKPCDPLGVGQMPHFICRDALKLYREVTTRGVKTCEKEPFVGNNMWFFSVQDPDGYKLAFESPTDVPEETTLSEYERGKK